MPTQNQPWLRAELIAAPETTPGAQLMIPADGVEFHDDQLVFHHQGDIVYVAPQGQLRSITWFAKQPNPETARRKAQWPNHGARWTDEERADLLRHLRAGHSWKAISHAHGRSRTGCQQEAVKQGWLNPETLQPTAELLLAAARDATSASPTTGPLPAAEPTAINDAARDPAATPDPRPVADPEPLPGGTSDSEPDLALTAFADALRKAALADASADPPQGAFPVPAKPIPSATSSPKNELVAAEAEPSFPAPTTATAVDGETSQPSQTIYPDSGVSPLKRPSPESPSPGSPSLGSPSAAPLIPETLTPDPVASAAAPPPDRPRIPPRVPRQRTSPAAEAKPGNGDPGEDSDPDSGSGPASGPGSRFISRAQSSLARATLGAYMNPPRGQSGAPSAAT